MVPTTHMACIPVTPQTKLIAKLSKIQTSLYCATFICQFVRQSNLMSPTLSWLYSRLGAQERLASRLTLLLERKMELHLIVGFKSWNPFVSSLKLHIIDSKSNITSTDGQKALCLHIAPQSGLAKRGSQDHECFHTLGTPERCCWERNGAPINSDRLWN